MVKDLPSSAHIRLLDVFTWPLASDTKYKSHFQIGLRCDTKGPRGEDIAQIASSGKEANHTKNLALQNIQQYTEQLLDENDNVKDLHLLIFVSRRDSTNVYLKCWVVELQECLKTYESIFTPWQGKKLTSKIVDKEWPIKHTTLERYTKVWSVFHNDLKHGYYESYSRPE